MAEENERLRNRCRLTQVISFFGLSWPWIPVDLKHAERHTAVWYRHAGCDFTSVDSIWSELSVCILTAGCPVCLSQNQDFSLLSLLFSCLFEQMRQTERGVCWIRRCTGLKTAALFWSAVLNPSVPLFTGSFRDMERTANKRYVLLCIRICIQWRSNDHELSA